MLSGSLFARIARKATARPLLTVVIVGMLALAGAVLAARLEPKAGVDTLVDTDSKEYQATERFKQQFGDEPVVILVKGNLQKTILTDDILRITGLEGCLAGNVPEEGLKNLPKVCQELAELHPAKVVYGPGTFVNTAANQIAAGFQQQGQAQTARAKEAAEAARKASKQRGDPPAEQERLAKAAENAVMGQFVNEALKLGLRYGLRGIPRVDDPSFVSQLVFDPSKGPCVPEGPLLLSLPELRGRPHPRPAPAQPHRGRARPGPRPHPRRHPRTRASSRSAAPGTWSAASPPWWTA